MKKAYILVHREPYEGDTIYGVYSKIEKAEKAYKKALKDDLADNYLILEVALDGAYGTEPIQKLMKHYAEAFNHITTEVLPMLGMSSDAIEDLVAGIDEAYEPMKSIAA